MKKKTKEIDWIDMRDLTPAQKKQLQKNWEHLLRYLFDEDVKVIMKDKK